jgi:hypothetical protein
MNKISRLMAVIAIFSILGFTGGCASNQTIPIKVQSDPLGAYVVYQKKAGGDGDWIYLGKTPLTIQRSIGDKGLKKNETLRLRIMKEGYNDQIRDWSSDDVDAEISEKDHLFWNPRLVPSIQ